MMDKLQGWWRGISTREQRLVAVGGGIFLIGLCYWLIWQPVANRIAERERQVINQQQTLAWLKEKGQDVLAMQAGSGRQIDTSGTLDGVVNRTAFNQKIKIARLQPQGQELQVWIDTVPFDDLLLWLATLSDQHGVQVQIIEVARENLAPGLVKVRRLQLSRPL
ncbi:general secretion pathway protein M [Aeromonas encheleia]|uniref:Type II secretion system protein M n=1 Tax=Aeromonas encheleia TaxID=73010 RepID=A0AAE9SBM8_9GAMM|nr:MULTISPECIES: GspM family type II secretion system protein ExeM [Aeromonas]MBV7415347.1 GspM family type II secretion system protein ExeM [Aeromonas sp. sif2433]MBV7437919.1 GspM family type II secretion system protein ExeM [Aeromonas sp. sif2416]MBV7598493.1 GspM family type II secretion system protein ExeM [Aeromonas sp. sia0103]UNP88968.1 GspM family type II secretion system protein ExeM [Aeromonas encheleia]USV57128.1 GspM family type II secretion system protein ExeM [Aeromonas enchelei